MTSIFGDWVMIEEQNGYPTLLVTFTDVPNFPVDDYRAQKASGAAAGSGNIKFISEETGIHMWGTLWNEGYQTVAEFDGYIVESGDELHWFSTSGHGGGRLVRA